MATTYIHSICSDPGETIAYVMRDRTAPYLRSDIDPRIRYVVNDRTGEVTYTTLNATLNCTDVADPANGFRRQIAYFGQRELQLGSRRTKSGKPILAWHLIQSFEGAVDPRIANGIGCKLAEKIFPGRETVVSTHTNTDNVHNHIVVCTWDWDGRKWNNCHESYQQIRTCSDQLCEQYGLSVLEETREVRLHRWLDSSGKVHYYEPTERKESIREQRARGAVSHDDVDSYRNTLAYQEAYWTHQTNITIVRRAIDEVLPFATSYEHMLDLLRERGYTVKAQKKDGEWRKAVSYTAPETDVGIRDTSLGEDYLREALTRIIETQNRERKESEELQARLQLQVFDRYQYGTTEIGAIHEDYRARYAIDGSIRVVTRTAAEKIVIRHVKQLDRQLCNLPDAVEIQRAAGAHKEVMLRRREEILQQIREAFWALRYLEATHMQSSQQMRERVEELRQMWDTSVAQLAKVETLVERLEAAKGPDEVADDRERLDEIRRRMSNLSRELGNSERCLAVLSRIEKDGMEKKQLEAKVAAAEKKKRREWER